MGRRTRRKAKRPPGGQAKVRPRGPLLYKVVELSTVDEASLEKAINDWIHKGWYLESVQFAMRDSSKRPAMAFVFFTREGEPAAEPEEPAP